MLHIARSELVQMFRNRQVLVSGLLIPLVVSGFLVYRHEQFADGRSLGFIAAIVVFSMLALGLYTTTVTTVASRRQNLFLKRLRSTALGDAGIVTGLVLPATTIALAQLITILAVFSAVATRPADLLPLVAAIVATTAMMVALALATAGLTNSPEHAQVTTLPVSLGLVAVTGWVGITGTENLTLLKRLLPGGAATELIVDAWNSATPLRESLPLLAITAIWAAVAVAVASRLFQWEPRH